MQSYQIFVVIICLAAGFYYINYRFIRLTPTVGIMAMSLAASLLLQGAARLFPGVAAPFTAMIGSREFHSLLVDGMLSFLLFAGSIHIDARRLKKELLPVITLSTVGVLISTVVVGVMVHYLLHVFGMEVAWLHCLLFAALISPTDPIAVLAILKKAGIAPSLELKIAGESLFNDGVAVVVFLTILEIAQPGSGQPSFASVSILFAREALGGLLFGLALGYASYFAIRSISKYEVEIMISIATVMGGYMLAGWLGVSGPLAMVVAGIVIGSKNNTTDAAPLTHDYFTTFWELIDELLNALLFMLVGFEMLVIPISAPVLAGGLVCIVLVLAARWLSVALPVTLLRFSATVEKNAIAILTWGGLRGGLSIALALSLPGSMHRDLFVALTYIIVVFSILVQGLTIGKFYKWLQR